MENNIVVPPHVDNPEDVMEGEENAQVQDEVRSHHSSPQNFQASSKATKLKGRSYQAWKMRINNLLNDIEANSPSNHSEHLKEQASLLSSMLKSRDIDKILVLCKMEPDFFTIFGETDDNIHGWRLIIKDLLIWTLTRMGTHSILLWGCLSLATALKEKISLEKAV